MGWRVLVLLGGVFLLVVGARTLGQQMTRPVHPLVADLRLCNDGPCAGGVAPGLTEWEAAFDPHSKRVALNIGRDVQAVFFPSVDGQHVGRAYVDFPPESRMAVGWLVAWYGEPCGISYYPRADQFVVRYPHTLVNLSTRDALSAHTPVVQIQWADPAYTSEMQPDICIDNITDGVYNRAWRGFTLAAYTS